MRSLVGLGVANMFRGARRGQALVAGFGAALTLVGLLRRRGKAEPGLLHSRKLRDGESVTIRFARGAVTDDEGAG